jgi:hypothetical protein
MALVLRLLKFAPVRAALMWLLRSRVGRRLLRSGARHAGRLILASLSAERRSR